MPLLVACPVFLPNMVYSPLGPIGVVCTPEDFCYDLDSLSASVLACLPQAAHCCFLMAKLNGKFPWPLGSCHIDL